MKMGNNDTAKAIAKEFIYELEHDIQWFKKWNKSEMNTKDGKAHDISCIQAISDCLSKFSEIIAKHGVKVDE